MKTTEQCHAARLAEKKAALLDYRAAPKRFTKGLVPNTSHADLITARRVAEVAAASQYLTEQNQRDLQFAKNELAKKRALNNTPKIEIPNK